ncbi:putative bifunctional diguanylate cyclase/phosphodiesterase [Halioxenophilus aromaticivorans]|uniref:EAL domain-containing protein n=1 Tax=Halioxenophilus aromaticivorans TaxID=1306992 RepID=A0AAV3U2H4_9ALTE
MSNLLEQAITASSTRLEHLSSRQYFAELVSTLSELVAADYAVVCELSDDQQTGHTLSVYGRGRYLDSFSFPLHNTASLQTIMNGACCLPDRACERFPDDQLLQRFSGKAFLSIVLKDHAGRAIGLLSIVFSTAVVDSDLLTHTLRLFALRASAELERSRHEGSINQLLTTLHDQNHSLLVAKQIYSHTSDGIIVTNSDNHIIYVNQKLEGMSGYSREELMGKSPQVLFYGGQTENVREKMWQALKLNGVWQGELVNRRKNGEYYSVFTSVSAVRDNQSRVQSYVFVHKDTSQERAAQNLITYQATHDQLTGLLNRYEFNGRIDNLLKENSGVTTRWAFFLIDLDDFKEINDSRGHLVGDQVLSAIAARLMNSVSQGNLLARLGGDEFGVFARVERSKDSAALVQSLLDVFKTQFILVDGSHYTLTASIGISFYPDDAKYAEKLYSEADQALYSAKLEGKNTYAFFNRSLKIKAFRQQTVKQRLHKAIVSRHIEVHFQPIIHLQSGVVSHCEALARWTDEELGEVSPEEFIPVAENYGLMPELGYCVAEKAIKTMAQLNARTAAPIGVAINRSPQEFVNRDVEPLVNIAKTYNFPAELVNIELTESLMVKKPEKARVQLRQLQSHGFGIAMDDFGTGYSSLAYLRKFPFHVLKIDREFIADICERGEDYNLVKTIIEMARNFKLHTVAEGVETKEQMLLLRSMGCDYGQGFYFSRPLRADALVDYVMSSALPQPIAHTINRNKLI